MKLILGSGSKGRKFILENAGYDFDVMTADIDEKAIRNDDYEKLPLLIARAKAEAIFPRIADPAILITSDQVVVCDGELREKPKDKEEARKFLKSYAEGKVAQTNTAVVVVNTGNGKQAEGVDVAKVYFKEIPDEKIGQFVEEGNALSLAGGFTTDNPVLLPYIDRIEGDEDSVIGLPMKLVEKLLDKVR